MDTIVRAAATYWFLYFVLRFMGRRALQQTTGFELILLFLLGGISIQAIVTDDRSLVNAWLAIATIALMHISATVIERRFGRLGTYLEATPIPIVEHGVWYGKRLDGLRLLPQDIMASARQKGIMRLEDIDTAIVERNGSISVTAKPPNASD